MNDNENIKLKVCLQTKNGWKKSKNVKLMIPSVDVKLIDHIYVFINERYSFHMRRQSFYV